MNAVLSIVPKTRSVLERGQVGHLEEEEQVMGGGQGEWLLSREDHVAAPPRGDWGAHHQELLCACLTEPDLSASDGNSHSQSLAGAHAGSTSPVTLWTTHRRHLHLTSLDTSREL